MRLPNFITNPEQYWENRMQSTTRPAQMLVAALLFVVGGGTDALARVVAQHWSKALGGNVVVENRPWT